MNKQNARLVTALSLAVLGAGLYFGWLYSQSLQASRPEPLAPPPIVAPPPQVVASAPEHPVIAFPVEPLVDPDAGRLPPMNNAGEANVFYNNVLSDLLGRANVLKFVQFDDFARRVVATVDNLARAHAAPALWPVNPTPDRFTVLAAGGSTGVVISPDNSLRYAPLVQLIEAVDARKAVALYARLYPLFQQAYEDIGFPGRYFNDRLVAVIDHLLTTPVLEGPLAVSLVDVKGSVTSTRPWVRYEFVDPALQRLSSGQKMLLRVGPENHRRLRARLQTLRGLLTAAALAKAEPAAQLAAPAASQAAAPAPAASKARRAGKS